MTRLAQLSIAELIARGVPLSTAEAVSLTLAISAALGAADGSRVAVPADEEILLSSTGEVALSAASATAACDETTRLAALLHRLLRLDETTSGDRRGRAPGALLVILARTLRQIDLPPLGVEAFRDALARFAGDADPAMLAAVFWRAARMRPRKARLASERRAHGAAASELRRALRQTERELFTMRTPGPPARSSSRKIVFAAALVVAALVVGVLGIGSLPRGGMPADSEATSVMPGSTARTAIVVDTAQRAPSAPRAARNTAAPRPVTGRRPAAGKAVSRPLETSRTARPAKRARTVDMVNLPRSTWSVVR